jgi:hypothetical protein
MTLNLLPGDQGVMGQVMSETECFDVFLKARRYDPLVPPEPVSLEILSHLGEESLNLSELRICSFGNILTALAPFSHDVVEEEYEPFGEVRCISGSLIRGRGRIEMKTTIGQPVRDWLSESCVLTLISFSLVS